jgi:hypothetical protein
MVGGKSEHFVVALLIGTITSLSLTHAAWVADRPKIVPIVSDDFG